MKMRNQITYKLTSILLLLLCFNLLFSGCAKETATSVDYFTTVNGQDITISFPAGTRSEGSIKSDNGVYSFSYSDDGSFSVVYPNGDSYSHRNINGGVASSADFDYDKIIALGYIDGLSLERAVQEASRPVSSSTKAVSPILSALVVAVGVWFTWKPKSVWWLARGWMFKNVEPSDLAFGVYRGIGIIIVTIGIISFFA